MGKKLSEVEIGRYGRDGFVCPIEAFRPDQAHGYLDRLEAFEQRDGKQFGKGHNFKPHLLFTWVDEIVHHPAVLDAVEDLIGPDIRLFHLSLWPKSAHDPAFVSWHQDATYFGLEPALQVTAWIALTDAPVESGCMEVVPGSHRSGQLHHGQSDAPHNLLSRGQTVSAELDRHDTVFMPVRAGQMSLHHTIAASGLASATSRPMSAAIAGRDCRRCWCAAPTGMGISTTRSGRGRITAPPNAPFTPRRWHASARPTPKKPCATRWRRNESNRVSTGVPAKAGTHPSTARASDKWIPAFAGTPIL